MCIRDSVISVMPCTSKKAEAALPTMKDACGGPDVDVVITTRELVRMLRCSMIDPAALDESSFDSPLGSGTGAAVIFGATGGVMEAALRTAYALLAGEELKNPDIISVRGLNNSLVEATVPIPLKAQGGKIFELRVAVVNGALQDLKNVMKIINEDKDRWHFIEVMNCPGGCVNGGGQPIVSAYKRMDVDPRAARAAGLYAEDESKTIRKSHENPDIQKLYAEFLGEPNGHLAHKLLRR